jgi:hypothetical protein
MHAQYGTAAALAQASPAANTKLIVVSQVRTRRETRLQTQRAALKLLWCRRCDTGTVFVGFDEWIADRDINLKVPHDKESLGGLVDYQPDEDNFFGSNAFGRQPFSRKMKDGRIVTVTPCRFLPMAPPSETVEQRNSRRRRLRRASVRRRHAKSRAKNARQRRDRLAKQAKRRHLGIIPHTQSLSRTQPWLAEGISRRTWYTRHK